MAVGALIIKQETGLSDEGMIQAILEDQDMPFIIGLREFTTKAPFAATTTVYFRKSRIITPAVSFPAGYLRQGVN